MLWKPFIYSQVVSLSSCKVVWNSTRKTWLDLWASIWAMVWFHHSASSSIPPYQTSQAFLVKTVGCPHSNYSGQFGECLWLYKAPEKHPYSFKVRGSWRPCLPRPRCRWSCVWQPFYNTWWLLKSCVDFCGCWRGCYKHSCSEGWFVWLFCRHLLRPTACFSFCKIFLGWNK